MLLKQRNKFWFVLLLLLGAFAGDALCSIENMPHRILLDTDVDTDDFFALLYLLKLNRSEFELEGITINTNSWTNAGHAVNQIYDLLYMMNRDDVSVGVGGEGGILENGTILPNIGGYLPIIEQGMDTVGGCRYRQAIPLGVGGRLDIDTNFGLRKAFLPQGRRKYEPLRQPSAQQVMIEKISQGPITVFLTGVQTNFAIFLMNNPNLKKNVNHIYIMGGGVRARNPTGCCPKNASSSSSCVPRQCGDAGNLFSDYNTNPFAEFNIFGDPFAAYQVLHSGIPITLIPLDATNTIPISKQFFEAFEQNQHTFEAQYCFKSLKMARDTWFDDQFYTSYFMWDSFTSGVAVSIMSNSHHKNNHKGENEFAEMEFMNITVTTSNKPYGISDGSNPFFDDLHVPKFALKKGGVHSGHVQQGLRDPFCFVNDGKGTCKDGFTVEVNGSDSVQILVATRAKFNKDPKSPLDREFFVSFLEVLNRPQQAGRFNFTTQFPYYREVTYKPDFKNQKLGKHVIFDMDMSVGDFLTLFYLLKVPVQVMNLAAIIVSPTGWANAATIDVVYDLLHMMGRDDIHVGLGDMFATNESDPVFSAVGGCKYVKAIPHGNGGFLDSDTLYGLARLLPRSPRRYTAENSVKYGAPRDTDHPELRQPLAMEVWESVLQAIGPTSKVTVLANGPLTNLAKVVSLKNMSSRIQEIYVVGGNMRGNKNNNNGSEEEKGNVMTSIPTNKYAEMNMFLDPLAAKTVFESALCNITLIPLSVQRTTTSFSSILRHFHMTQQQQQQQQQQTPEAVFVTSLISRLHHLKQTHHRYHHMKTFLGEILGAMVLSDSNSNSLNPKFEEKNIEVIAKGRESCDGETKIDEKHGKSVRILQHVDSKTLNHLYTHRISDENQYSAKVGSFEEQRKRWAHPVSGTV